MEYKKIYDTDYSINQMGDVINSKGEKMTVYCSESKGFNKKRYWIKLDGELYIIAELVYKLFYRDFDSTKYYVLQIDNVSDNFYLDNLMLLSKRTGLTTAIARINKDTFQLIDILPSAYYISKTFNINLVSIYKTLDGTQKRCGDYMFVKFGSKVPVTLELDWYTYIHLTNDDMSLKDIATLILDDHYEE